MNSPLFLINLDKPEITETKEFIHKGNLIIKGNFHDLTTNQNMGVQRIGVPKEQLLMNLDKPEITETKEFIHKGNLVIKGNYHDLTTNQNMGV